MGDEKSELRGPRRLRAVAFEFLRVVAFAARDTDLFFNGLLVMVFSSDIAAQIGAATGASPGRPGVVALTLLCAGESSAFARYCGYRGQWGMRLQPRRLIVDGLAILMICSIYVL